MKILPIRNSINRSPLQRAFLLLPFVLACFALLPSVQAAPDPAPPPGANTRDGAGSMANITTGNFNTAFGTNALNKLTTGNNNTAQGNSALFSNAFGSGNVAIGNAALRLNRVGKQNTAVGYQALYSNGVSFNPDPIPPVSGDGNVAVGWKALYNNTTGLFNTATGFQTLSNQRYGVSNTATGAFALGGGGQVNFLLLNPGRNTATGVNALYSTTDGSDNTATGINALFNNTTGSNNVAMGGGALRNNTTGHSNIALGSSAGSALTTGGGNVAIGRPGVAGASNQTWVKNIDTTVQNFSAGVNNYVTVRLSDGRLGNTAVVSSRRYKEEIKPLDETSQALFALKPVSFRLKKEFDPTQALGFGLIAEDVEKVDPDLVYRNDKGQVESVRYEMVNAMLLNEFLKEHRAFLEEQQKVKKLEATVADLGATVKEQAAQIQKVSDQVKLGRSAPQIVRSDQ